MTINLAGLRQKLEKIEPACATHLFEAFDIQNTFYNYLDKITFAQSFMSCNHLISVQSKYRVYLEHDTTPFQVNSLTLDFSLKAL